MIRKKRKEKTYGLISFDYPRKGGAFLVPSSFKEKFKRDIDFKIRTEIIRERLDTYKIIKKKYGLTVESVKALKKSDYKKSTHCLFNKVIWGERWECDLC